MDDNSYKNISNDMKRNFIEKKAFTKKSKINEFLNSVHNNKNKYNNNNSLNRENKNYMSQTNTLEISQDYKNTNESNMTSYILPTEKKESNNKIIKKDKINNKKIKDKNLILNNNNELASPRNIVNNKNIKAPKTDTKIKGNHKFIKTKKVEFLNNSSLQKTYKHFDSLKQKGTSKTYRNFTENNNNGIQNEKLNNNKLKESNINHDNIKLVKIPETKDSDLILDNIYSTDNIKSINHNIISQTKKQKRKNLSLVNHKKIENKKNQFNSLNENNIKRKRINKMSNINKKNKNKCKNENNLTQSLHIRNDNHEKIHFFSEDKIKQKHKYDIGKNINFNDIEKILDLNYKINDDEIINEIDIDKNENKNNFIPDNLLEKIPEEDGHIFEKQNKYKRIKLFQNNANSIDVQKNRNINGIRKKEDNPHLFLNHHFINFNTKNNKPNTTKTNIKKITEYFQNNRLNNHYNLKYYNNICNTVRYVSSSKIIYTENNENNKHNQIIKQNKLNKRFIKLNQHIEEIKKESEKIEKLKEKYENLINILKNDINQINIRKSDKLLLEKYKENHNDNNEEINKLKEQINKIKKEMELKDDINNQFMEKIKKDIDLQNKKNNDLEMKIKLYKAIIQNNENEYLNKNDINNLIIISNSNNQKQSRNNLIQNDFSSTNINNQLYNRTFYNINNKNKNENLSNEVKIVFLMLIIKTKNIRNVSIIIMN